VAGRRAAGFELDLAAILLRSGPGLVFLFAGLEKVLRGPAYSSQLFSEMGIAWPELTGPIIGYWEVVGSICLLLGILTRPVALLFAVEMLVAIVSVRLGQAVQQPSVAEALVAIRLELVLALAALALALLGAGRWSLDQVVGKRWTRRVFARPQPR
jgi:putative oxidoreductase